jgi:hypothetical protein
VPEPWRIHFFQRHRADDPARSVPTIAFLDSLPVRARAEVIAVLDAVAEAPPPAFSGGGKWEAMHGDMAGFYEIRVRGADRLFGLGRALNLDPRRPEERHRLRSPRVHCETLGDLARQLPQLDRRWL